MSPVGLGLCFIGKIREKDDFLTVAAVSLVLAPQSRFSREPLAASSLSCK